MTESATIALGYLPPSYNATIYSHWSKAHKAKQQLQFDLEMVMLGQVPRPIPGGRVRASAVLLVPDRRRRDTDNYRTPVSKACGDALVNGGFIPDDDPEHYTFGDLTFEHVRGVSATRLTLTWGTL